MGAYYPVNDPQVPLSMLAAYQAAAVDVVELGIRTDNPYADGHVIRDSMARATGMGTVAEACEAIGRVRDFNHDTLGMIFAYAEARLAPDPAIWSGVDGLLCLGTPDAQSAAVTADARANGARVTRFVPYALPAQALEEAVSATGFVMLQYTEGKTGIRTTLDHALAERLWRLRQAGIFQPVMVGIGISTLDQIRHAMDNGADGIIVGSMAVLKAIEGEAALLDYLCSVREVLDGR